MEQALRKDISASKAGAPPLPLMRRARILVGTYEDIARLFPNSDYVDKALWQGATLAADVFGVFKDAADSDTARRLLDSLTTKFPSSPLAHDAALRARTLGPRPGAPGAASAPASIAATAVPPVKVSPARPTTRTVPPAVQTPAPSTASASTSEAPAMLRAIKREVLPDVLRVTLELDRETIFKDDRIDGPPRVFVDLQNTRAGTPIQDARLGYDDDVVRQIRVGRQLDRRIRVVLDLSEAPRHSVYTLYNPFRVVIDFERRRAAVAPPATERIETEALLPLSDPDEIGRAHV